MITDPTVPIAADPAPRAYDSRFPALCWRAILGGTVVAIGIHILLTVLGVGAGLATFTPITDADPVAHFSGGAAFVWTLCALVSLLFGSMLAGRFSQSWHTGFVHGILVWSLTLIITLLLVTKGTGLVLGGGLKVLGAGIGLGAKTVAGGVDQVAQDGVRRSGDQINSFINEAVESVPTNAAPKASIRAKREVGFAIAKMFDPESDINSQENRAATIQALVTYTQMSPADATMTVDGWITSYKDLNAELDHLKRIADQKAREKADQAAHELSKAAIWSFFALLVGLIVSALGGSWGAKYAVRHREYALRIQPRI